MNNKMLRGLVEAGAVKAVSIIANGAIVHAEILTLSGDKKVITTQAGTIKTWGTIDSALIADVASIYFPDKDIDADTVRFQLRPLIQKELDK